MKILSVYFQDVHCFVSCTMLQSYSWLVVFFKILYTKLRQTHYSPHGDWSVMYDSAPSGGFEVMLFKMLCFPLFIYQSGLELWCACSEEF